MLHRMRLIVGLGLTALAFTGSAQAQPTNAPKAKKHTPAQAEKTVKAEIANRYELYAKNSPDDKPIKLTATCSALTNTLFKCSWLGESGNTSTAGKAKVKFYSKGSEATFSDVACGVKANPSDPLLADVTAESFCDEDPHNG